MTKQKIILIIISAVVLLSIVIGLGVAGLNNPYDKQIKLAYKFLNDGNYEEAILAFNKAIDIEPKRYEAYLGLSDVYIEKGDYDKAIEILQKGLSATGGNEVLERKLSEVASLNAKNSNSDTSKQEEGTVGTLSISDFSYHYNEGGHIAEVNDGAVGGMNLSFTVNGPSNVCEVRIATWQENPYSQEEVTKQIKRYEEIWGESWEYHGNNTVPFEDGSSHPVKKDLLGKKVNVLLIGLDKDCKAVGYAVVEEIVG